MPGNRAKIDSLPRRLPAAITPRHNLISNRYTKILETPVSRRKQTTAPRSNRYKSSLFQPPNLAVDPAAPNSRDYRLAITHRLHRRGKRS